MKENNLAPTEENCRVTIKRSAFRDVNLRSTNTIYRSINKKKDIVDIIWPKDVKHTRTQCDFGKKLSSPTNVRSIRSYTINQHTQHFDPII
jgi:hypothetical protein